MYGKKRVVLSPKTVTSQGHKPVAITGGRGHHPIGFWYQKDGKFYADLTSIDQWHKAGINIHNIANKGLGGVPTQKALRAFVMDYYSKQHEQWMTN
jgi:hypothetical protein